VVLSFSDAMAGLGVLIVLFCNVARSLGGPVVWGYRFVFPAVFTLVMYPVPATGTRSPQIAHRQSAIDNLLSPKPSHNPNP